MQDNFDTEYAFFLGYRSYEEATNGNDRGERVPAINPYVKQGEELLRNEWEAGYRSACIELYS